MVRRAGSDREISRLLIRVDTLLAASPDLAKALHGIERAARSDAPILILGEPGTGRSTLARAIHAAGPRQGGPLVEVDTGSIPATLFESELFGHRAGAFTGAAQSSPGRVGLADGGTLVLDHVEELPLAAQPKLLRLLAERRYAPLGDRERDADVRFIALAGEDLSRRVERGAFRADLFYRLEVLAFRLPPLRKRPADLETIRAALLGDLAARFGREHLRLTERAAAWMQSHPWPGNLRQMRNVLERALITSDGPILDPPPPRGEEIPLPLCDIERDAIRRALAFSRGNQTRAAEILGISRKTLWEKRRRFDLP